MADYVEVRRFDAGPLGESTPLPPTGATSSTTGSPPIEADTMEAMDGTRTVADLVVDHMRDSGDLDVAGVAELVRLLLQGDFLTQAYVDVPGHARRRPPPPTEVAGEAERVRQDPVDRVVRGRSVRALALPLRPALACSTRPAAVGTLAVALVGLAGFVTVLTRTAFTSTPCRWVWGSCSCSS